MTTERSGMSLEMVREWHRALAAENASRRALCAPNGERWELCNDEFNKHVRMADAIDAHLAASERKVPDAMKCPVFDGLMLDDLDHYEEGYARGWNACRQALLTQRASPGWLPIESAPRDKTIYDHRMQVTMAAEQAGPRLYAALNNLLDAVKERRHILGIESIVLSDAESALQSARAAAPTHDDAAPDEEDV